MEKVTVTLKFETRSVAMSMIDGTTKTFTLREFSGLTRDEYLDAVGQESILVDGKVTGFKKFSKLRVGLLALCLHDENGNLVSEEAISKYPNAAIKTLYKMAQDLNGLGATGVDTVKNA